MKTVTDTTHSLEMLGPRNIAWRTPNEDFLKAARLLAFHGRISESITAAEDAYILEHGSMCDVSFRVKSITQSITFAGGNDPRMIV